jgi:hypothetical protein
MLSDAATRNHINPFVVYDNELPGTWSRSYPIYQFKEQPDDGDIVDAEEESLKCPIADTCENKIKPNCPMHRMLEPARSFEYDFWVDRVPARKPEAKDVEKSNILMIIFALLVIYLVISIMRS